MSCVLRVHGGRFDVDGFLAVSPLKPIKVWHAGEPRLNSALSPTTASHSHSGFTVDVSDAEMDDTEGQVNDVRAFIEANESELARLRSASGVDDMFLDFGIMAADGHASVTLLLGSPLLAKLGSLRVGICATYYLSGNSDECSGS